MSRLKWMIPALVLMILPFYVAMCAEQHGVEDPPVVVIRS